MNPALTRIFANNNKIASQLAPRVRQAATTQVPAVLASLDLTPVIPKEAFDLSEARKNLPHHRFTFDALEAFFKSQHNHLLQLQASPKTWPKTTAAALEKVHQLVRRPSLTLDSQHVGSVRCCCRASCFNFNQRGS